MEAIKSDCKLKENNIYLWKFVMRKDILRSINNN